MENKTKGHVLIMAGGTGGHVMPAMALAKQLVDEGYNVNWLGVKQGLEEQLVKNLGLPFTGLQLSGLRHRAVFSQLKTLTRIVRAFFYCLFWFRKQHFDLVIGMGGYVTVPGGVAAWILRIPLLIHEQNAIPGLANQFLSKFANKTLCAFPDTWKKAIVTGNPVRQLMAQIPEPSLRASKVVRPLKILILGGSQGASILNQLLPRTITAFPIDQRPKVWHQTGRSDYESVRSLYIQSNVDAIVSPFIDDMPEAYQWADLVVARAGAMTVSEIAAAGVASILVPYRYAVDNHQWHNAKILANAKAAILLNETELDIKRLYHLLEEAYHHPEDLVQMAIFARKQAVFTATQAVVAHCLELLHARSKSITIPS